jgi:hypothetical protein
MDWIPLAIAFLAGLSAGGAIGMETGRRDAFAWMRFLEELEQSVPEDDAGPDGDEGPTLHELRVRLSEAGRG